jgi:hypothetical protein
MTKMKIRILMEKPKVKGIILGKSWTSTMKVAK